MYCFSLDRGLQCAAPILKRLLPNFLCNKEAELLQTNEMMTHMSLLQVASVLTGS
jgi:hypothetical protein